MKQLKSISVSTETRLYILFALAHGLYTCLLKYSQSFSWLSYLLTGCFKGGYEEYMQMFPTHYGWLFILSIPVRIFILLLVIYPVYKIVASIIAMSRTQGHQLYGMRDVLRNALRTAGIFLMGYLLLYGLLNMLYEERNPAYSQLQLALAQGFLLHLCLQLAVNIFKHRQALSAYLRKYFFEPQLPYNIAILRIIFFSYMVVQYGVLYRSFSGTVSLSHKESLPFIGFLIDLIPVDISLFRFFSYAGIISCILIVAGIRTRWFLIVNAVCCFYVVATPNFFGKLWHNQILIWISWFFTFAKCYDVLSIDSLFRKIPVRKSPDYTFPVRFVWLQFGLIYSWAGFYKLWDSGFDWALSRSMINQVQLEWLQHYDKLPVFRIDQYPFLLYLGGLGVILFELSYILLVLKKGWRWLAFAGGVVMHVLNGVFLYILFFLTLWIFYFFYFDFNVFFRKKHVKAETDDRHFSSKALYAGFFILAMNCLAGMFNIDTYPFSAYPKYSALIPDRIGIIRFECSHGTNVHETGRKNGFQWENYGLLELDLVRQFKEGKDVTEPISRYWEIWQKHNPQLLSCDTVRVYLDERPVSPEGKDSLKTIGYICTINTLK